MSDPNQPADGARRPLDLKARLRTSASVPTQPSDSGVSLPPPPAAAVTLPPPPARAVRAEAPTPESIEAARRRAEEVALAAGPAFEEFSIGGAPERTPVPVAASSAPSVTYVDVPVHELTPEMKRKHRFLLIGVGLGAGLVAFLLGLAFSSAGALSTLKDNMVVEAEERLSSLESQQPNFELMRSLAADLKAFNAKAAALVKDGKDLLELEGDVGVMVGKVQAFVDAKAAVDPGSVIGTVVYNGPLISRVLGFALRTQTASAQAEALLEEARTLVGLWRPVPPEQATLLVFVDPIERDHPELGKIPTGKGRVIKNFGNVAKVDARAGTPEFVQKVILEGDADPIEVRTTQIAQTDFGPFFGNQLALTKNVTLRRLVELSARLQKALEACSPDATLNEVRSYLGRAPVSDTAPPQPEGDATPKPEGETSPKPEGETSPKPEGETPLAE